MQYGVLTADEGLEAINSGRLPEPQESIESQKKFKELKDEGYYNPLIGGNEKEEEGTRRKKKEQTRRKGTEGEGRMRKKKEEGRKKKEEGRRKKELQN